MLLLCFPYALTPLLHVLGSFPIVHAGTYPLLFAYHSNCNWKALELRWTKMKPFFRYTDILKENLKELFYFKGYTSNSRLTVYI